MPISRAERITLKAISPRLAINIFFMQAPKLKEMLNCNRFVNRDFTVNRYFSYHMKNLTPFFLIALLPVFAGCMHDVIGPKAPNASYTNSSSYQPVTTGST